MLSFQIAVHVVDVYHVEHEKETGSISGALKAKMRATCATGLQLTRLPEQKKKESTSTVRRQHELQDSN